jgi:DNA polymerase-1
MKRALAAKARAEELDKSLPFNPRSPKQVKEYMLKKYKVKLESSDEDHLQALLERKPNISEIETILESRGLTKDASTYGEKWVQAIEDDGRIYPSYNQILETGRVSAGGDVPIQTTPHKDEYRSAIMAAPGCVISIRDYSAQEPRILAYITQDKKLIDIFKTGKDVYISIGYEIFEEVFDKKDPRRQHMKSIILGISYGMSIFGLAAKMGVDEDTAVEWLNIFFSKFIGVKEWVDGCQEWKPYTTTILGRKFWGNPYSNGWKRNYQNFPMQGSAADCTKIAAARTYQELGYNPFLIYMHDELVAEFTEEQFKEGDAVMHRNMIEVQEWMHEGIPGALEAFVGADWSVKK